MYGKQIFNNEYKEKDCAKRRQERYAKVEGAESRAISA